MYDAVAHFNVGNLASLLIYDVVGVERVYWAVHGCIADDNYRLSNSRRQSSDIVRSPTFLAWSENSKVCKN